MPRTIEITVDVAGDVQVDAIDFAGPECEKATAFLEELGTPRLKTRKAEFRVRTKTQNKQRLES